jgi:hypothetical protein
MSTEPLALRQARLVDALVCGAPVPAGFAPERIDAARQALLAKRCSEVARHWPVLLAQPVIRRAFVEWAADRPKTTSFGDGLAFVREQAEAGRLSPAAADELRAARRRSRFRR